MLGYWSNHAATAQIIKPDGWLHTCDQPHIGESGHVYITARLKDILLLSNGEKIPPGDPGSTIALDRCSSRSWIGEGRPYLSALLVLDGEHWPASAQAQGGRSA
jgi:long-chain acyl-CoA synthetase